jgi:hypothetical protein
LAKILCRRRKGTWGSGWGDYEVIKGQSRRQSRDGNTSVKAPLNAKSKHWIVVGIIIIVLLRSKKSMFNQFEESSNTFDHF